MSIPVWVEIVNKLATPAIAAISAFYVYLQYKRARRWKAADLAASLLEKLDTDQALALARQALDWGVGPLIIPEQYRPLFRVDGVGEAPAVMQHDPAVLCLAVQPNLTKATLGEPRGLVYRYCFIKLFDYLNNTCRLLADGQLREEDIADLKYWLEKVREYLYAPDDIDGQQVFQPALRAWSYDGVVLLGRKLKIEPWTVYESAGQR